MAVDTKQSFLKGINRRFSRKDSVDPEFFYTLQNARILSRGGTGTVQRIKGYSAFKDDIDYSKTLDIISFKSFFIVLYENASTANQFHVEIIGTNGTQEDVFTYQGTAATEGKLTISGDAIYVTPHNKVLYYNDGNWQLKDYISEIPTITGTSLIDNSTKAKKRISIQSGAGSVTGTKAKMSLAVAKVNVPRGESDVFQVEVDGNATGDITILYTDNPGNVRDKIYDAINATSAITQDWTVTRGRVQSAGDRFGVFFEAKQIGEVWNGKQIKILNSDFGIVHDNDDPQVFNPGKGDPLSFDIDDAKFDILNATFVTTVSSGGADGSNTLGPLHVEFGNNGLSVTTKNITTADDYAAIGAKIIDALNAREDVLRDYDVSSNDTGSQYDIDLEAKKSGKKYNTDIKLYFIQNKSKNKASEFFTVPVTTVTTGEISSSVGTLPNHEDFWYKVRARYKDGHITATSLPVYVNTGAAESVQLTIETNIKDIDDTFAEIEVYRKQKEGNFFLIGRERPSASSHTFTDDGKPKKRGLDEKTNLWVKKNGTEEIVGNKLVKANVDYFKEEYAAGSADFTFSLVDSDDENEIPKNSLANIYIRPQYEDGTFGYHQQVGSVQINDYGKKLAIQQDNQISNPDKTIKDIAYYANYDPYGEEFTFPFNSIEIANRNLPTIADQTDHPNRTRIFFGFKFIEVTTDGLNSWIRPGGWDVSENDLATMEIGDINENGPINDSLPQTIDVNIFGIDFTYVRYLIQEKPDDNTEHIAIYKLDVYEALNDAVKTGQLKVRFSSSKLLSLSGQSSDQTILVPDGQFLREETIESESSGEEQVGSVNFTNKKLTELEVRVTNLIDHSLDYGEVNFHQGELYGPSDTRLYIELEESPLDFIDNPNLNSYQFKAAYSNDKQPGPRDIGKSFNNNRIEPTLRDANDAMGFEFINFKEAVAASLRDYGDGKDGGQLVADEEHEYYTYHWTNSIYDLLNISDLTNQEELIYLTKRSNTTNVGNPQTVDITGFINERLDNLNYVSRNVFNIYDVLVEKTDINTNKTAFGNLLVWSDDIFLGTRYSGIRNISSENFFTLPSKHGDILDIRELNGRLYVFCETAVATCLIGETITRQKGGEVFVTDSNFITAYFWPIDDLQDVKRDSIISTKNQLIFTDGFDVYRITGEGTENITDGAIPLDVDNVYGATLDNDNKEYRLSDLTTGQTWVYNFEGNQWYGPFTYVTKKGTNYRDYVISAIDSDLVRHNQGNTFGGGTYTTIIQSVANDTEQSFVDKVFRKFYIELRNAGATTSFKYGKDYNSMVTKSVANIPTKRGYLHQGVQPSEKNAKTLYWDIETQDADFELADIGVRFNPRDRL